MKLFKLIIFSLVALVFLHPSESAIASDVSYRTYTQDGYGNYVETQTGYIPVDSLSSFEGTTLSGPQDMKLGPNNELFISDSGNRRILVVTSKGELIREITDEELVRPNGLFISEEGKLFVADEGAGKVFVFTPEGEIEHVFEKPDAPSFGETAPFIPLKLAVDGRENIYVISRGNNNGLIMLNASVEGEFLGYFAPNETNQSVLTEFRKFIFSDDQLDRMLASAPDSATNLTIDNSGLIYTVTTNENDSNTLKKLNMGGNNLFPSNHISFPSSVAVGQYDNIYIIAENGYIYEFTSEGEFLFMFGGVDDGHQRKGLHNKATAIVVDDNDIIYTLDEQKNEVQSFVPSEFAGTLHLALDLYQNGRYEESKPLWADILKMNSQFDFASLGIGEAFFREENYDLSLQSFRRAKYVEGYSDSFWEVRNVWIRDNIITMLSILIFVVIILKVLKKIDNRYNIFKAARPPLIKIKSNTFYKKLMYLFYFAKHPFDGAYGIQYEKKTSVLSATMIYLSAIAIFILDKYYSGFIFRTVMDGYYAVGQDILTLSLIGAFIIISTYLVTTITDGEATFAEVFQGYAYSLGPYILFKPIMVLISNVLTLNESFIIGFLNVIILVWSLVLVFISIKELNGYKVKSTVRTFFLTGFSMFISAVTLFIMYSLFNQLTTFIVSIYGEVVYRIGNL